MVQRVTLSPVPRNRPFPEFILQSSSPNLSFFSLQSISIDDIKDENGEILILHEAILKSDLSLVRRILNGDNKEISLLRNHKGDAASDFSYKVLTCLRTEDVRYENAKEIFKITFNFWLNLSRNPLFKI